MSGSIRGSRAPDVGARLVDSALAGLVAAALMLVALGLLRLVSEQPLLSEWLAEATIALVPVDVFRALLSSLGGLAKPLLAFGISGTHLLAGTLGGLVFGRLARRVDRPPLALGVGVGLALGCAEVAVGLLGVGLARLDLGNRGVALAAVAALTLWALYGFALALLAPAGRGLRREPSIGVMPASDSIGSADRSTSPGAAFSPGRRGVLAGAAAVLGSVALGIDSSRWLLGRARGGALTEVAGLEPEVTPSDRFYVVSKNIVDPAVPIAEWRLRVGGLARRELTLSLADLTALPSREAYVTLECIGNEVGGELIGNALWRGVPLARLLDEVGVAPESVRIFFTAADDYSESLPVADARDPEVLVAFAMNGEPLTRAHGFPVRLIIPGRYGMKHVKWLTEVRAVPTEELGFWERRGWDDAAIIKTTSRIDVPRDRTAQAGQPAVLGGVALGGRRGIRAVEVSVDRGATWQRADLQPALAPAAWALWTQSWTPARAGWEDVQVRALDGTGAMQDAAVVEPLPTGASGYHQVVVRVREPVT